MRHVFTDSNPMQIHRHMATAYAHFRFGFLEKKPMTKEMADKYDKAQADKKAAYTVPQRVRDEGCHYGKYMIEDEIDFIMTKENAVFFWAHMRESMAILSAYNLVHETSEERGQ